MTVGSIAFKVPPQAVLECYRELKEKHIEMIEPPQDQDWDIEHYFLEIPKRIFSKSLQKSK